MVSTLFGKDKCEVASESSALRSFPNVLKLAERAGGEISDVTKKTTTLAFDKDWKVRVTVPKEMDPNSAEPILDVSSITYPEVEMYHGPDTGVNFYRNETYDTALDRAIKFCEEYSEEHMKMHNKYAYLLSIYHDEGFRAEDHSDNVSID